LETLQEEGLLDLVEDKKGIDEEASATTCNKSNLLICLKNLVIIKIKH